MILLEPLLGSAHRQMFLNAAADHLKLELHLFLEALYTPQPEVNHTAIAALGRLGDVRALPHLQPIANNTAHPLCPAAIGAIALIKRTNPEMMTLLRGSSAADAHQETLLRPAAEKSSTVSPDLLLRPSAQGGDGTIHPQTGS